MDSEGFPIRVLVHPANEADKNEVKRLLRRIPFTARWRKVIVDQGYDSPFIAAHCRKWYDIDYEVVKKTSSGFELLPKRWVVERTFAWLGKYRRLSKDYEYRTDISEAFIYGCSIHILVRRLANIRF